MLSKFILKAPLQDEEFEGCPIPEGSIVEFFPTVGTKAPKGYPKALWKECLCVSFVEGNVATMGAEVASEVGQGNYIIGSDIIHSTQLASYIIRNHIAVADIEAWLSPNSCQGKKKSVS